MILYFIIIYYFIFTVWTNGLDKNYTKMNLKKINL